MSMRKIKPGPQKGIKHSEIERSVFGQRLFQTRKARGLTQNELASKIGLSNRMISHYETTSEGLTVLVLKRFADALNVTTSYLLGESSLKIPKDDIKPGLRKHLDALQRLPDKDRKAIMHMVELAAKNNGNGKK